MRMRVRVVAALALAALALPSEGRAQSAGDATCEQFVFVGTSERGDYINTCAAGSQQHQFTIYIPRVVQRALGNSFGFGPRIAEPAGLSSAVAGDLSGQLSPSDITILPTADIAAAAAPSPKWNAWLDGRYLYSDYSVSAGDIDGPTRTGIAGLDYKLNSKVTLGLLATLENTDLNGPLSDLNSTTYGIGPYLGILLSDNIVFSANFQASHIDSEQAGGLLDYNTDRLQASTGVTGYFYSGTWRTTPSLTLAWSKDWEEEANGFTPDRTIETGVLTPSVQFGKTLKLSDTATVEPWAGAALDWTFLADTHTSGGGTVSDPTADLRLQAGLNFSFGTNTQLAITGEAAGLLVDDLNSYSIEANLAVQF